MDRIIYRIANTIVNPINNSLKLIRRIEEENEGFAIKICEGSFNLHQTEFDFIVDRIGSRPQFEIYEATIPNPTLFPDHYNQVYLGNIEDFNDFDFNQRMVTLKSVSPDRELEDQIKDIWENEVLLSIAANKSVVNSPTYGKISDRSYTIPEFITAYMSKFGLGYTCYLNAAWYNAEYLDFLTLRLVDLRDLLGYNSNSNSLKKITLKRLLEVLKSIFQIEWYMDANTTDFKFKSPLDLITNQIDLTAKTVHLKQKVYDNSKMYRFIRHKFNTNNLLSDVNDLDWNQTNNVVKFQSTKLQVLEHDLTDITTLYLPDETPALSFNTDGWFLCMLATGTNNLQVSNGFISQVTRENAEMSIANILRYYHRDFTYTQQSGFSTSGDTVATKPVRIQRFIELPEVKTILPSLDVFYDGILFEYKSVTNYMTARVAEQSTDLNSLVTTFRSYEFENTLSYVAPPEPPVYQLEVSPLKTVFYLDGTVQEGFLGEITIISDTTWTAVSNHPSWFNVSENAGSGNAVLTVTCQPTSNARSGYILVSISGKQVYVQIIQNIGF